MDIILGDVKLPKTLREAYLNLSWTRKENTPLVDTGWEVAYDQFVLPASENSRSYKPGKTAGVAFTVDKSTGALNSLTLDDDNLLTTPLTLSRLRIMTTVIRMVLSFGDKPVWNI